MLKWSISISLESERTGIPGMHVNSLITNYKYWPQLIIK